MRADAGRMKSASGSKENILIYAASESDADAFYFSGVFVPDPFIAIATGKKTIGILNALEFTRVARESSLDEVWALEDFIAEARERFGRDSAYPAGVICLAAEKLGIPRFSISSRFPAGVAFRLQELEIGLDIRDPLFPDRALKTDEEAVAIRAGNDCSAAGFRRVEQILRRAEIRRGKLYWEGRVLTSERVREEIEIACIRRGAVAEHTIVAGGDQACDPHCRGTGPLRADSLIIVDIFPRVAKSGYHGDMTRTYLKGKPSPEQRRLMQTVFDVQQWALSQHLPRRSGRRIYEAVKSRFEEAGYSTRKENGRHVGFFHGLGHGLGLEVHEPPRVNPLGGRLSSGQVVTVEPGLYYPGLGGCRIEDVVRVRRGEPELLSRHPYRWHFR